MTLNNDNELKIIGESLNNDEIRVKQLEDKMNGFKDRNVNNQSVIPTVPPLDLQNISQNSIPLSKTTSSSSRTTVNPKNFNEQHEKEIRKKRYDYLLKYPNERKTDDFHVQEFNALKKEFGNSSSVSSIQGTRRNNNTSRLVTTNSARGGRRKTRKTKRRGTKKNLKSHKKRRSLKKRH